MRPSATHESRPDAPPAFTAVVPAAGVGARMGGRKPLLPLAEAPILLHALRRLRMARGCAGLVLAVHAEDMEAVAGHREEAGRQEDDPPVAATLVEGGRNRQESVLAALRATDPDVPLVLIHDAVRPLVRLSVIEDVAARAAECGAAIAAAPAVATIKEVGPDGVIRATPPRDGLRMAQTPQGFRREVALEAHLKACRDAFVGTDDSLLVERMGGRVAVVEDRADNIKITTPEDLVVAEAILAWQRREGLPEARAFRP